MSRFRRADNSSGAERMPDLRGAVVAAVTPMGRDQSVDLGAWRALLDSYVDNQIHGLYVLASQGEFFSLEPQERATRRGAP